MSRRFTWTMFLVAIVLLALGFAGYLHPDMRLDWAVIAQMCGLR